MLGALDVGLERSQRVPQDPVDADRGSQVVDDVRLFDQALDQIRVQDRAVHQVELRAMLDSFEIGPATRREVVQHGDAVAAFDESLDQVGTDETRAAGDQRALH